MSVKKQVAFLTGLLVVVAAGVKVSLISLGLPLWAELAAAFVAGGATVVAVYFAAAASDNADKAGTEARASVEQAKAAHDDLVGSMSRGQRKRLARKRAAS